MRSRKFVLAVLLTLAGIGGWFQGLPLGEFTMFAGLVLGAYGVVNVADKQVQK
jgi:hypothetical protein